MKLPFVKFSTLNSQPSTHKGFTLIELLVVIAIIGVLASLGIVSFSGAQEKARDAQRKSDLVQVRKVLELVKSDCKGGSAYYPGADGSNYMLQYTNLMDYLTNANLKYMDSPLNDPKTGTTDYAYADGPAVASQCPGIGGGTTRDGTVDFVLFATLERGDKDSDAAASRTRCAGKPGNANWNVAGKYVVCN